MTPAAQNEAIAKWMGWTINDDGSFRTPDGYWIYALPNFANDLNAMAAAEYQLDKDRSGFVERSQYALALLNVLGRPDTLGAVSGLWLCASAPAAQRAEALLRALNLWTD